MDDAFFHALPGAAVSVPAIGAYFFSIFFLGFLIGMRGRVPVVAVLVAILFCAVVVVAMAFVAKADAGAKADDLIRAVLAAPTPEYSANVATLTDAAETITAESDDLRPALTEEEQDAAIADLRGLGLSIVQTERRRQEIIGRRRFQAANADAVAAAIAVDAAYEELAACFRSGECAEGELLGDACRILRRINTAMDGANAAGAAVANVVMHEPGEPAVAAPEGGAVFEAIRAPNVTYLGEVCAGRA